MKTLKRNTFKPSAKPQMLQTTLALSLCCPALAFAALGENLTVDMRALSMGNAVIADPPGISSIHYNPAGLANIQGLQTDVQGALVSFNIRDEISAPPGFNVFGYSDDDILCDEPTYNSDKLCSNFKPYAVSKTNGVSLYVPGIDKQLDLPDGLPAAVAFPSIAYKPPGSKFTYGTAVYAPMMAGYNRDNDDVGRYLGERVILERITYLSPTVAYQVDDNLSLGAGVNLNYSAVALKTRLRFPNELIGVFRMLNEDVCSSFKENGNIVSDLLLFGICNSETALDPFKEVGKINVQVTDSASPGYNLGLLWEPSNDFAFGLTYRGSSKMKMKGRYTVDNGKAVRDMLSGLSSSTTGSILTALLGFPASAPLQEKGLVSMDLTYPESIGLGIKYKLFPEMQFNVDANWMNWNRWNRLNLVFDRPVSALQVGKLLSSDVTSTSMSIPMGTQSNWSFAFGWEYSMTDRLKFRLGYEPRHSAVPMDKRNTLAPINNAQLFGSGIGYRFDPNTDIDLTMAMLRSRDNIPANTSSMANKTGVDNFIINPYAGLDVKTRTQVIVLGLAYRTRW